MVWVAVVLIIGAGIFFALRPADGPGTGESVAAAPQSPRSGPEPTPEIQARADSLAKLGPRSQKELPPVPFQGYAPPRPVDVIEAAYRFAADHPEILSYIPCYCGCEQAGHQGNHDCFVKARDASGNVTEWDPHGVECTVCIDVANRSRQLFASGASVRDIRAAIEKEFGVHGPSSMPAAHPPAAHSH